MPDNIDQSLRALCHAQENKIKAQQHSLNQFQLGIASVGTLAAHYKAALDSCIKVLDTILDKDSCFQDTLERAKKVSESNGRGTADAILKMAEENQRLRSTIAGYQTEQDQLEAKVISQRNEIAKLTIKFDPDLEN
jgi:hypothetical protein